MLSLTVSIYTQGEWAYDVGADFGKINLEIVGEDNCAKLLQLAGKSIYARPVIFLRLLGDHGRT